MQQYYDYNFKLRVHDKLFTPTRGVKLTGGLFRRLFDNNNKFNLNILEMDRMRYWFDKKQGRPTTAEPYPGHFEWNLKGQTASQFLMAAGNALRWEEIPEVRKGMNEVLGFIEEAQEVDGFCMPIDKANFGFREYPHYVRIWLNYGLIAAGRSGDKRAFRMLRLWQDWFNRCPDLPIIKYTELAFQGVVASTLVYLTEAGVDEDMTVTRKYYEEGWRLAQFIGNEKFAVKTRRQPGVEPHPHGSELEAFEGYLDLYRYTGAPYYLAAVKNVLDQYKKEWQHPGGGIIMCEGRGQSEASEPQRLIYFDRTRGYNEFCCTAFWMGLHQRMHRLYPDEESHVFELEQSIYNIGAAAQAGDYDIRYLMFLDEKKAEPDRPNHCCAGVGTKLYASLPEYLFSINPHTVSCDIYGSAVLSWQSAHQLIDIVEETDYPYDNNIKFTIKMEKPQEFTMKLRIPHYVDGDVAIYLNGEQIATGKPGTYENIYRQWQPGDVITYTLPWTFEAHPYQGCHDVEGYSRCAYTYGPLLLAVVGERTHEKGIPVPGTPEEFLSRLRPTDHPHEFTIEGMPTHKVMSFMDIDKESFACFPLFEKKEEEKTDGEK